MKKKERKIASVRTISESEPFAVTNIDYKKNESMTEKSTPLIVKTTRYQQSYLSVTYYLYVLLFHVLSCFVCSICSLSFSLLQFFTDGFMLRRNSIHQLHGGVLRTWTDRYRTRDSKTSNNAVRYSTVQCSTVSTVK